MRPCAFALNVTPFGNAAGNRVRNETANPSGGIRLPARDNRRSDMRSHVRRISWLSIASPVVALCLVTGGCGFAGDRGRSPKGPGTGGSDAGVSTGLGGSAGRGGGSGATGGARVDAGAPTPTFSDFPATPVVDPSAPPNAAALFDGSAPRTDGAPCITAPVAGTLMPRNWLRPRFELTAAAGENLFEIDLSVSGFAHPLRSSPPTRATRSTRRPGAGFATR